MSDQNLPTVTESALRGLRCKCPSCGKGKLYAGFLSLRQSCDVCGCDYAFIDSGDGPAVFIIMIAGALILKEVGISATPILGAAGVLGLALGFGAQSLMKDFVAGFFLLLENQVARGDVVDIGGKTGTVEDVRLRFVQLRDYEGNVHFIPNGIITVVTNMSRGFAYAVIEVGVVHGTDISQVYESLRAVAKHMQADPAYRGSIEDELEITGIERMDGTGVTVRSRLRVRALEQWRVRREFLHRLRQDFDRREIKLLAPPVLAAR